MFTLEQIAQTHKEVVKTGADFPKYVRAVNALGVAHYDFMVADGRAVYHGKNGEELSSQPKYAELPVADMANADQLRRIIAIHQQGQTDFLTFCKQSAEIGVEKWTTDTINMVVIYYDKAGNQLLAEPIPQGEY